MRYLNLTFNIALLLFSALLSACATPASRSFETAEKLETEGRYEEAMYGYAESFKSDPTLNESRIGFLKARQKAADQRYDQGMGLVAQGNYVDALTEFQAAQNIDPTQGRFVQKIEMSNRYKDAQLAYLEGMDFEKVNKLKDAHRLYIRAVELLPENSEYKAALERVARLRKSKLEGYELRLKSNKPITLKFNEARLKDVFNILTQLSGINFVFDEGIKDTPVSILLENASFRQALDLLTSMNRLSTKNLNESTVLVYMNSPEKNKQYDDMVLRTFHLNYMDAKKAINLIRTLVQVRKVYVNEDSNSIVVRDTESIVAVVEKILDANDLPEAEVVLDVEVIEISDKNAENLGLLLSNYNVQLGMFSRPPDNQLISTSLTGVTLSNGNGTATVGNAEITNLIKAFSINRFGGYVTLPNATFNFGKTLAKGDVLSNPKIRVKNKEKAKFNVGTRVPITTTTLNGTVSQVNVQYIDVGVKVNAEPSIHPNNEISIKLNLEVSTIITKETVGGVDSATTVVTIGTRNLETVLSLKNNETSVIGGLIQRTETSDKSKIYILSDIPLIGPFFTNKNSSKEKTELMLAITPRLVRGVPVPLPDLSSFISGKEDNPSLVRPMSSFDLEPVFEGDTQVNGMVKEGTAKEGAALAPVVKRQVTAPPGPEVPAIAPVSSWQPLPPQVQPDSVPPAALKPEPAPAPQSTLQIAAPASVAVGQQFSFDIKVSDVKDLAGARFVLTYDPALMEFMAISEGMLLRMDGRKTSFSSRSDAEKGTVAVNLGQASGNNGVSGAGTIVTALFRAKKPGAAVFAFTDTFFSTVDGGSLNMLPSATSVEIR